MYFILHSCKYTQTCTDVLYTDCSTMSTYQLLQCEMCFFFFSFIFLLALDPSQMIASVSNERELNFF